MNEKPTVQYFIDNCEKIDISNCDNFTTESWIDQLRYFSQAFYIEGKFVIIGSGDFNQPVYIIPEFVHPE